MAAILLHFVYNFTVNAISPISDRTHVLEEIILGVVAVATVLAWGAKMLRHYQAREEAPM